MQAVSGVNYCPTVEGNCIIVGFHVAKLTRSQACWHAVFLFCFIMVGDGWGCVSVLRVFEESLGSSVSNVAVSMVTKGFPRCFESYGVQKPLTHIIKCVCVCVYTSAYLTWAWRGNIPVLRCDFWMYFFSFLIFALPQCFIYLLSWCQLYFTQQKDSLTTTVCCCWSDGPDVARGVEACSVLERSNNRADRGGERSPVRKHMQKQFLWLFPPALVLIPWWHHSLCVLRCDQVICGTTMKQLRLPESKLVSLLGCWLKLMVFKLEVEHYLHSVQMCQMCISVVTYCVLGRFNHCLPVVQCSVHCWAGR